MLCALRSPASATVLISAALKKMASPSRPSSNMAEFRNILKGAKHIVALTGAGTSAESGVPTFRGAGGWWRIYRSEDLASPAAFRERPALVWEFYQYRRQLVSTKEPNQAHLALADLQRRWEAAGRRFRLVTQNVDGLHQRAGSERVLELHGGLFRTRCTACGDVRENRDDPVCPALAGAGSPDKDSPAALVAEKDLPRCSLPSCGGLLRPDIIWFGENLDEDVLEQAHTELELCDLCLVVGTSSVVYPAAMFAPMVAQRGVPVAEFNLEMTPASSSFGFHFSGPCGPMLSEALAP